MIINIKVKPSSKGNKIEKISDKEYLLRVKEPAKKDKANLAALKILKKKFGKNAKIVKGRNSRNKAVEIL